MTWTAAVIGCGRIGSAYDRQRPEDPLTHAGAYQRHPDTELVAGVDPDPARRAAFTAQWGAPAFASIDAMLAHARPQVWSVCTPPETHGPVALRALAEGAQALWCEKPMAPTLIDGLRLVEACRRAGVPLLVNHTRRFDAAHQALERRLRAGEWGAVERVVVHYVRGLGNYGSHAIDLLRWLLQDEPARVSAIDELDEPAEDVSLTVLGRTTRGVPFALLPMRRPHYDCFEVDLWGTRGRVTLSELGARQRDYGVGPSVDGLEEAALLERGVSTDGLRCTAGAALDNLLAHLRGEQPLRAEGSDALRAVAAIEAARASWARGGTWIDVDTMFAQARAGHLVEVA